ncbi:hypothetical protein C8Q70DRAFT_966255 [Cubamyces menziesii]|nr:hypothetical protein C8Q70DRAFT_966255 [Cubamyces menziesii]
MTFTFAPDFVLKRRRKRSSRPIDPCLGFYPDLIEEELSLTSAHALMHSSPGISVHESGLSVYTHGDTTVPALSPDKMDYSKLPGDSNTTHDTIEAQLTVEGFLCRAASPTKRYTRHRARQREKARSSHVHNDDPYIPSSDPTDESDGAIEGSSLGHVRKRRRRAVQWTSDELEEADASHQPAKRRRTNGKKSQKLSTRLLLAGASTGVDLLGGPLLPLSTTHIPTRRPIPLVPANRMSSPPANTTVVRGQYVDPRHRTPFHNVSYQFSAVDSDHGAEARKAHARPVTAWRPTGDDASREREGARARITRKASQRLVMVPLVLAQAPSRDIGGASRTTATLNRSKHPSHTHQGPIPFVLARPLSPKRPAPSSVINLRPCSAASMLGSSTRSPMANSCEDLTSPRDSSQSPPLAQVPIAPSTLANTVGGAQPLVLATSPLPDPALPLATASIHMPASPARRYSQDVCAPPAAIQCSVQSCDGAAAGLLGSTIKGAPSMSLKPMKSLGMLMDDFREIARSATQNSLAIDSKPQTRPRPTASSQSIHETVLSRTGPQHPGLSSLRPSALPTGPSPSLRRLQDRVARKVYESEMGGVSMFDTDAIQYDAFDKQAQTIPRGGTGGAQTDARFDVLSALRSRARNIVHLSSSPLPGWSILPQGTSSTPWSSTP